VNEDVGSLGESESGNPLRRPAERLVTEGGLMIGEIGKDRAGARYAKTNRGVRVADEIDLDSETSDLELFSG
jgi:hypothetical protein